MHQACFGSWEDWTHSAMDKKTPHRHSDWVKNCFNFQEYSRARNADSILSNYRNRYFEELSHASLVSKLRCSVEVYETLGRSFSWLNHSRTKFAKKTPSCACGQCLRLHEIFQEENSPFCPVLLSLCFQTASKKARRGSTAIGLPCDFDGGFVFVAASVAFVVEVLGFETSTARSPSFMVSCVGVSGFWVAPSFQRAKPKRVEASDFLSLKNSYFGVSGQNNTL